MVDDDQIESLSITPSNTCSKFDRVKLLCLEWYDDWGLTLWQWPYSQKNRALIDEDIKRLEEKKGDLLAIIYRGAPFQEIRSIRFPI